MNTIVHLRPRQFAEKLANTPEAILLDVRRPEEFQKGFIKGAINLNFEDKSFTQAVELLDKDKSYFLCCRAGNRSEEFGHYLLEQGFSKVFNLESGIFSWINYGNLIEC